ncbi:MAG: hypothetical protein RLZZ301_23 [Bacteroidota bacterium]|jgi:hypothetical protein
MKALFLVLMALLTQQLTAQEILLSLEGTYQEKNLLVNNPPAPDGFGFCVSKVLVNGEILPAVIQTSHFEIDFTLFHLKEGDPIFIVLEHHPGCEPRFLNPEVLLAKSTFTCTKISAQKDGTLNWTCTGENGSLDYQIEQYRWKRWVEVGEVKGKGSAGTHNYTFQVTPHSGKNTLRISQTDNTGQKRSSSSTSFESGLPSISLSPMKVHTDVYFKAKGKAAKTKFEVYDAYGNLLKTGVASSIDCRNLVSGVYFINFDNQTQKIIKIDN